MTYTEAITVLQAQFSQGESPIEWGDDIKSVHENFLTSRYLGNQAVFITDFPAKMKPFYAFANDDGETVSSIDTTAIVKATTWGFFYFLRDENCLVISIKNAASAASLILLTNEC